MQIRWKASFSASCLHAAACMLEGLPIIDSKIAAILSPAVDGLSADLKVCDLAAEAFLPLLVGLAADFEGNRQLVEMAATRARGTGSISEAIISRLAGRVADLEAAWLREQPDLVEQLDVRGRPLREQWEARGPGLLRAITQRATENFLAPQAECVLVSPIVGGHGRAHLRSNRVTFEAVLTNPHDDLPEVLRLGWLLSQLHLDVPVLSEPVPQYRLPAIASLATLPLVLAAAEEVELAKLDETMLSRAVSCWHLPVAEDILQKLFDWWNAFDGSRTRWPVALSALDQMLMT